jgi:hypothetical protein
MPSCLFSVFVAVPAPGKREALRSCDPSIAVQVFAALRSDFSTRRRERCMRLDFSGGLVTGVDDLERQLRDAVKSTFEARAAAYDEEVVTLSCTPPIAYLGP